MSETKTTEKDLLDYVIKTSYDSLINENDKMNRVISFIIDNIKSEASNSESYEKTFVIIQEGSEIPDELFISYTDKNKDKIIKTISVYFIEAGFDVIYDEITDRLTISWKKQFYAYLDSRTKSSSEDNKEERKKSKPKKTTRKRKSKASYENMFKNELPDIYTKWKNGKISSEKASKKLCVGVSTFHRWVAKYEEQLQLELESNNEVKEE